ncbi:MAG TPA: hypothetical protein VG184_09270 [Acidimicrobiales bacterium]|nr:hypothetical protein [Acidimicrobiales bacterium]
MPSRHVVVDGSNIATEGRSLPSLGQLDQAVREFLLENPDDIVTVVVDASFGHRIDPGEVATFEEAEEAGEVVSPPAGAIGRGDAFLLRIAEKTGATVLSNDSFQEFHGEHDWLFEIGRLIGGKPVPGVGWIFTPRTPVRGPKSREAVKEAKRRRKTDPAGDEATGLEVAAERAKGKGKVKKVERAIARATEEAVDPTDGKRRRRQRGGQPPAEPVNEPLAFITFIAAHPLGSTVTGVVESFSSHGAFIVAEGTTCYVPLSALGDPAPRAAREVLSKGEECTFVVQALDPLRRGVELALPGFAQIAGAPTEETVEAEISARLDADAESAGPDQSVPEPVPELAAPAAPPARPARKRSGTRPAATRPAVAAPAGDEAVTVRPAVAEASDGADLPARIAAAPGRRTRKKKAAGGTVVSSPEPRAEAVTPAPKRAARTKKAAPVDSPSPTASPAPAPSSPARSAGKRPVKKPAAGKPAAKKTAVDKPPADKRPAKKRAAKKPPGEPREVVEEPQTALDERRVAVGDGARPVRKRAAKKTLTTTPPAR